MSLRRLRSSGPSQRRHARALMGVGAVCLGAAAAALIVTQVLASPPPTSGTNPAPAGPSLSEPVAAATGSEVAAMGRSVPTEITIPAIDLTSSLMKLGLDSDGSLEVPPGPEPAGWFDGAPTPGELGPAIVVGHISYDGSDGVFRHLDRLSVGDEVSIDRRNGTRADFQVTRISTFPKDRFPSELVYGNIDHPGLRLVTCDGYNPTTGVYQSNLVVFATLI